AAVALPVAAFASLRWQDAPRADLQWYTGLALFLCFMVIWTHRANIKRLLAGTENRFAKK
ncbi:MAG: hypothetical protein LBK76_02365, partial [Verrucomicrobiales bacterium]|nr:hypothetical protein [Verrucomicrobiales bacterium]